MLMTKLSKKTTKAETSEVYLKVYDLASINNFAHRLGIGMYHTVIHVHGLCYSYGSTKGSGTGIYTEFPNQGSVRQMRLRKTILIGSTNISVGDMRSLLETLRKDYSGDSYHILNKNCNHFCNDFAVRLTGKPIPHWVNRIARIGQSCSWVFPSNFFDLENIQAEKELEEEKKKKRKLKIETKNLEKTKIVEKKGS